MSGQRMAAIGIKLLIIIMGITGIMTSVFHGGALGDGTMFRFYTIKSNLWMLAVMIVFLVFDIICLKKPQTTIPNWLYVVKYIATVSITLTFFVYAFLLAPWINWRYSLSWSSLPLHYLIPILSVVDMLLFDSGMKMKKWYCLLAVIPSYYYCIYVVFCSLTGRCFSSSGDKFPYYFMDYETYGWFRIDGNGIGFFWWIVLLTIILTAFGLIYQKGLSKREELKKEKNQEKNYEKN